MRCSTNLTLILLILSAGARADAQVIYRINCGGPDYTDPSGNIWRSDAALGYFNVGESFAVDTSVEIEGTELDPLYRSHRYDSSLANPEMIYTFPVMPGFYSVSLHFAETYWGFEGRRRFGVDIEGETVLVDYDIVGLTGGKFIADKQQFVTQILDGDPSLTIAFTHGSIDHPLICGIVIESIPPSPIIVNGDAAAMTILKNSTCSNAANLLALEAVDPDTDATTLQWTISTAPALGDVSFFGGSAEGADVIVCYQPAVGQIASDAFTIAVTDGDPGNVDEIDVSVRIIDTQAPVITCPPDITLDADEPFTPNSAGTATAIDDFGAAPTIRYSDAVVSGDCPIAIELHRTWSARDAAGNIATCLQRISIRDNDTDGDGTVDCADIAPDDADVGGAGNADNGNDNGAGSENGGDNANGNDNGTSSQIGDGNSGVIIDPETGQPVPTDACCGGGVPAMLPFLLLGWRRRRRTGRPDGA
ncbi:MAG: hypothetical protein H6820_13385 [Phycisphaerales bacterium]|nr:hypothetical protein [Phycisphaerales bacterium]